MAKHPSARSGKVESSHSPEPPRQTDAGGREPAEQEGWDVFPPVNEPRGQRLGSVP